MYFLVYCYFLCGVDQIGKWSHLWRSANSILYFLVKLKCIYIIWEYCHRGVYLDCALTSEMNMIISVHFHYPDWHGIRLYKTMSLGYTHLPFDTREVSFLKRGSQLNLFRWFIGSSISSGHGPLLFVSYVMILTGKLSIVVVLYN